MSKEQEKIESILYEALSKADIEERNAYLEKICGTDTKLRVEIDSLLSAYEDEKGLLKPPPDLLKESINTLTEGPGTVIGRYKLLEKIGEGGMAVVYMAEQEKPIRRKVALKIIKLGMDTKQVIARFEAERQALAMMDHPNIAKVLDAGATETGRPYFVMELVTGVSITEYCDKNNLSTKERLVLFIEVCNAVQHAHQKGIIHRDIKPSNIMVTRHEGKPVPKVIDFGIAKATNQRLTEKTLYTRYAHIIGTPAYMSPEQAELSDLDIDTRSDIYSLGVLLYELLTGTTPFSEEQLREAGYIEMQRIIREKEPAKPSTKLSTLGETLTDIAKRRGCTPDLLTKAVRGDLDWIVMKTLEKDRIRRYERASNLALDIKMYLEQRPVSAHAPSTMYRLHKFIHRNRVQSVAALIILVLTVVLICIFSFYMYKSRKEGIDRARLALSEAEHSFFSGDIVFAFTQTKQLLDNKYVKREAKLLIDNILVRAQDKVKEYTDKIETNPDDANNYFFRSQCYDILGEQESAHSDMAQYATIAGRGLSSDLQLGIATRFGPAINSSENEWCPRLSNDGLSLIFQRNYESSVKAWIARRSTTQDQWSPALPPEGTTVSERISSMGIVPGEMTRDGLEFYYWTIMPDGYGNSDIYVMRRDTIESDWTEPENLGDVVNSEYYEIMPSIEPNGLELYFSDYTSELPRPSGLGGADLWMTERVTRDDPWLEPNNLGPLVNSSANDSRLYISSDGLFLFFDSRRSGGYGGSDLYMTRRKRLYDSWEKAINLGPGVNSPADEYNPCISPDGQTLYFVRYHDIWQVPIISLSSNSERDAQRTSIIEQLGRDKVNEVLTLEKQ